MLIKINPISRGCSNLNSRLKSFKKSNNKNQIESIKKMTIFKLAKI